MNDCIDVVYGSLLQVGFGFVTTLHFLLLSFALKPVLSFIDCGATFAIYMVYAVNLQLRMILSKLLKKLINESITIFCCNFIFIFSF